MTVGIESHPIWYSQYSSFLWYISVVHNLSNSCCSGTYGLPGTLGILDIPRYTAKSKKGYYFLTTILGYLSCTYILHAPDLPSHQLHLTWRMAGGV